MANEGLQAYNIGYKVIYTKDKVINPSSTLGDIDRTYLILTRYLRHTDLNLTSSRRTGTILYKYKQVTEKQAQKSTLFGLGFEDKTDGFADPRFVIYENTGAAPNHFYVLSTFLYSENIYLGNRIFQELHDHKYFPPFSTENSVLTFETIDEFYARTQKKDRFNQTLFDEVRTTFQKKQKVKMKYDAVNTYLSKLSTQKPLSPIKQDEILDALTVKYNIVRQGRDGSIYPYASLDTALHYTNYTTMWATTSRRNRRLWGFLYLVPREPDEIVDYLKDMEIQLLDTYVGRKHFGLEEFKKLISTAYRTRNYTYCTPVSIDVPEFQDYFKEHYGSYENFLSPDTNIDKEKN